MKVQTIAIALLLTLGACGKGGNHSEHQNHEASDENSPTKALENQLDEDHMKLMDKMDELAKLKREVQDKIAATPNLIEDKKKQMDMVIAQLDSANDSMMDWMHKYNPLPDSADQEKAREYLESEMEKVKKLKDLFNESIEKAKEIVKK
ncbi:MAG: hypothetical protein KA713_11920 [Chryseotalea sp. WA131a]|jgi:chromosome segregation ATPase|nr:MAG: hypothetical protein KA713_11920 [Chryseotalea sp. WA131a]